MINDRELKLMQNVLFDMICDFDTICRKFEFDYWLDGGTLLGAIRHQNFIPWDDDIDVCMTAESFSIFLIAINNNDEICKKFIEKYTIQTCYTKHPECMRYNNTSFAKIRDNNSYMLENHEKGNEDFHHGIFLDIFIVTCLPDKIINWKLKLLDELQHLEKQSKFYNYLIRPILKPLKNKFRLRNAICDKNVNISKSNHIKHHTALANKIWWKTDTLLPLKQKTFRDKLFYVPANYDQYLTDFYGDYNKLPPINDRKPKHTRYVRFTK